MAGSSKKKRPHFNILAEKEMRREPQQLLGPGFTLISSLTLTLENMSIIFQK